MVKLPSVSTHSHPKVAAEAAPEPTLGDLRFNTQPPEGGCPLPERPWQPAPPRFNTQPPEGGCLLKILHSTFCGVSTHSHPKVAADLRHNTKIDFLVSTHSHPKVAATTGNFWRGSSRSFNTQPPEGGCEGVQKWQKTPAVSTHSHPKVAAAIYCVRLLSSVCFNTQPPEGGCAKPSNVSAWSDSFNTQPPEGGCGRDRGLRPAVSCFNTQPPEGGCQPQPRADAPRAVSTHSHPKVAARAGGYWSGRRHCFNTQPPEGGCDIARYYLHDNGGFNTQPPEGGCAERKLFQSGCAVSTHSHPKVAANAADNHLYEDVFQHTATRRWLRLSWRHRTACR